MDIKTENARERENDRGFLKNNFLGAKMYSALDGSNITEGTLKARLSPALSAII
jgi:hypothetical protein